MNQVSLVLLSSQEMDQTLCQMKWGRILFRCEHIILLILKAQAWTHLSLHLICNQSWTSLNSMCFLLLLDRTLATVWCHQGEGDGEGDGDQPAKSSQERVVFLLLIFTKGKGVFVFTVCKCILYIYLVYNIVSFWVFHVL